MTYKAYLLTGAMSLLLAGCMSETTMGGKQGPISGAAGPNGAAPGADAALERCEKPLGVMTLVENQDPTVAQALAKFNLGSPLPVLRLIMQQSNCFIVADRGQAMQTIQQERALTQLGETRSGANMGGGQIVAADLALTPNVIFSGSTGGFGGGLGGLFGGAGMLVEAVAASIKFNSAQSVLTVTDVRSGLQIAAAQGTATAKDMSFGGAMFGGGAAVGLGAYGNTPEGKVVAAALMDAHNNVVKTVRGMPPLPSVAAAMAPAPSGPRWVANGNLKVRNGPNDNAEVIAQVTPGTVVFPTGRERNGWVELKNGDSVGWLPKRTVRQEL